jgi:hypothetical protein
MLTIKEIKKNHFNKAYNEAPLIKCKCGCGTLIKSKDKYARNVEFVNGHNGRKYDNPTQYKKEWNHKNRESRYENKIERGHRLKIKIIKLLGGKCSNHKCNLEYNGKNACVFQLHHTKPKDKLFAINTRTLINYSWEKILKELKKCELLCANCHFIKENKEY